MANRRQNYKDINKWRHTTNEQKKRYYRKTALYKPSNWTFKQDMMVLEHKITDTELSYKIGHSVASIQGRRYKLIHGLV